MKKNKITGLIGTIVLHAVLLILLLVIAIRRPQMQEEGGVPVMLGNTELSQGNADPYRNEPAGWHEVLLGHRPGYADSR